MQDPFAAMLGIGLEDDQKVRAMAEQLRNRDKAAAFFASTTVPQIAKGAQAERAMVQDAATRGGTLVNARKQREQQEQMQRDRFNEAERVRALERTLALQDRDEERAYNEGQAYEEALNQPFETYVDPKTGKHTQVRIVDGDILNAQGVPVQNFNDLIPMDEYDDMMDRRIAARGSAAPVYGDKDFEYTEGTEKERQFEIRDQPKQMMSIIKAANEYDSAFEPVIPGTAAVENLLGSTAGIPSTETMEKQAEFWRNWKFHNELEQRHEMFGSALTESEQREWRASTINPNMKAEQIQKHLQTRARLARRMAEYEVARLAKAGRRPTDLRAYGGIVNVPDIIKRSHDGSFWDELDARHAEDRARVAASGQDMASVPTMDDVPLGDLSLEELRKMAGE